MSGTGTGTMGQAIAGVVGTGGGTVDLIGHEDADKSVTVDVVVLAAPYPAVADVLAQRGDARPGTVAELPTTVLIAGDDAGAKSLVADLVTAGGLRALDAGSQQRVRERGTVGFLQITLAAGEKVAWTGGFAVVS